MTDIRSASLVGRDQPARILEAEIQRTLESHGGLTFVTGEAGIGKTALVASAVDDASRRGALVASGTCWDREGAPGFWPWVQVLRNLQRACSDDTWATARDAAGGELALLLGEVSGRHSLPVGDDTFGLSDAVTTLLVTLSRRQPVLVALDDLHWADPPSIRLLEFVARHAWFEQILVVGTYRDVEVETPGHAIGPLLMPLVPKATSITLTGLDQDAVGALLARTAGREPSESLVAEVHRRTGGNPFFVDQTAHLWASSNSVEAIAPGVRDAVERRLALLPEAVLEILAAGAVLGPEFDRDLLEATAEPSSGDVRRSLADAVSARLLLPQGEGCYTFVHDLVRETLYQRLTGADLCRRHATVVRAIERRPDLRQRSSPTELAHHAYLAVPEIAPTEAIAHLRDAGRDAWQRLAVDEAAIHLGRALELVPHDQPRDRAALALDLSDAQNHQGDLSAAVAMLEEVVAIASKLDDPELLAQAALVLRGIVWLVHTDEMAELATRLIREAHHKLVGDEQEPGREKTDLEREQELSSAAIDLARAANDDDALLRALVARYDSIWTPGTTTERLELAEEIVAVGHRTSDRSCALFGSNLTTMTLLEQGDPRYLEEVNFVTSVAEGLNSGFSRWVHRWILALAESVRGNFDQALEHLDEVDALDRQINPSSPDYNDDMSVLRHQQRWTIELLRGRLDAADALARSAGKHAHPCPELLVAVTAVQRGDVQAARSYLARVQAGHQPLSRWFEPLRLRFQAEVAAASGDPDLCEVARTALAPFAGEWALVFGDTTHGPFVFWSALVDAAQGRWDDAISGFVAARDGADHLGARPWSVIARAHLVAALLERNRGEDVARATELLDELERDASVMGMRPPEAARRARGMLEAEGAGRGIGDRPGARSDPVEAAGNVFRFDGQVWTLTYGGRTAHMPDAKGLRDLHVLVGRAGTDVRATELFDPAGGEVVRVARSFDGDPLLDEQAKASYRARLTQLDEEIDRALDGGSDGRAAELDREREILISELRRATGLGGRPRRLGAEAERARKAVSERIRDILRRLDEHHPALAEHLRASVATGASCRYRPAEDVTWQL